MTIIWVKNSNGQWYDLLSLNLEAPYFTNRRGVYVIWYSAPGIAKVIKVGQGNISERLKEHRNNPEILKYSQYGQIKVTWAVVDNVTFLETHLNGIEAFLSDAYVPLVGEERYLGVERIPVNFVGH